jgi:hypothetical protein
VVDYSSPKVVAVKKVLVTGSAGFTRQWTALRLAHPREVVDSYWPEEILVRVTGGTEDPLLRAKAPLSIVLR